MNAHVINLNSRPDRLQMFKQIEFPFSVNVFNVDKHENGSIGCIKSHLELYKGFTDGLNLILEDDCKQVEDIGYMYKALEELGNDWDALYLGAILHGSLIDEGKNYSKRLTLGWGTHAILYNGRRVSKFMLQFTEYDIHRRRRNIDTFLAHEVQSNEDFKVYITTPQIFEQHSGFSDILNEHREYSK